MIKNCNAFGSTEVQTISINMEQINGPEKNSQHENMSCGYILKEYFLLEGYK